MILSFEISGIKRSFHPASASGIVRGRKWKLYAEVESETEWLIADPFDGETAIKAGTPGFMDLKIKVLRSFAGRIMGQSKTKKKKIASKINSLRRKGLKIEVSEERASDYGI